MRLEDLTRKEIEDLIYKGRTICDRKDLGGGYCGSAPRDIHDAQMRDPSSWVHSSKARWLAAATTHQVPFTQVEHFFSNSRVYGRHAAITAAKKRRESR